MNTIKHLSLVAILVALPYLSSCSKKVEEEVAKPGAAEVAVETRAVDQGWEPRVLGRAPSFELTDQDGVGFSSLELEGKPWVANFMFTRCPTICPQQTALLRSLQGKSEGLQIVSFTVDPDNDTSAVLKSYAGGFDADERSWKFLTGSVEQMHQSISRDGFKLAVEEDSDSPGGFSHSPFLVLIDAYNRIRGLYDSGSSTALDELLAGLAQLETEAVLLPPAEDEEAGWLEARQKAQLETADSISAFHEFSFKDVRISSGVRFRNKMVEDVGRSYKPVHYDHGTGMAVADVDGDDLLDIYFVTQIGANELWKNLGGGKFEKMTGSPGIGLSDRVGVSASFGDIDNDGDVDLFTTAVRAGNLLFENDGAGNFTDITESSGVGAGGHSSGAVFFDYDRDGLLDLFVTNVGLYTFPDQQVMREESIRETVEGNNQFPIGVLDGFAGHLKPDRAERSTLFRNLGGNRFSDVSEAMGLEDWSWTGDASAIDLNSDGWPDLYVTNMQGDDEIYLNRDGVKFEKVSRELFPKTPWGAMGIKAFDFENDGDLDVYITDMHSDMSQDAAFDQEKAKAQMVWPPSFLNRGENSIFGNGFFRNDGADRFEEISDQIGAENYWPWGVSVDDLNADGFDDAFVTASMNFPKRYAVNSLLLNEGGKRFRDCEFILGVEPRASGLTAPWFDWEVMAVDNRKPVQNSLKEAVPDLAALPEKIVVWSALGSRSSVIFDLDNDGDLDIVTNELHHYPMVLLSDLAERRADLSYLKIKLVGTKSNRSALGAVVRVAAGGQTRMKVKDGQSGYLSHSDFPLYFGLDGVGEVDRIEVVWPSGGKQVIEGPVATNRLLTITEGE